MKRTLSRVAASPFNSAHPMRSLLRIYIFANVMALAVAFGLGGSAPASGAARAAFAWCGIG